MTRQKRFVKKLCGEHGVEAELLREGGSHLVWQVKGRGLDSRFVTAATPSDYRAARNNAALLRRLLRQARSSPL